MEDTLSKFMSESAKRHEGNSNLMKEFRASTDAAIRNQGASIKTLKIQIGQMRKVLQERGFGSLPSSTEINPRDQVKLNSTLLYKSRKTMVPFPSRLDNHYCEEEEGNYGPKFMEAYGASHINNTIPQKEKDPGSFPLPCFINDVCFDNALVDLGASVSVMPFLTYLNLGLGELAHTRLIVELADRTMKYPKGIAENVLVEIGKFTFPVDFIILDIPKDIKVPLILGRPFFLRERMELDLEARLMGETLVLNRSLDPFLEDYIELNDLNEPFELRRNQRDDLIPTIKEGEVIEEFRTRDEDLDTGIDDYPCYFLEDMDAYRDEGMGDIIVGEPCLVGVNYGERSTRSNTANNSNPPNETADEVTRQLNTALPNLLTQLVQALGVNRANQRETTQSCSIKTFMASGAKEFFDTEGAIGLLTWFESIKSEDFKKLLMEEYCPDYEIQKLETKFWNLKMVGSDIDGYTTRSHKLERLVPHMVTPDNQRVNRYIQGLAPEIKPHVTSSKPTTIQSAVSMANRLTTDGIKDETFKKRENARNKRRSNDQNRDRGRDDRNKRQRTRRNFAVTAPEQGQGPRQYAGQQPKCAK
ncbi:hypothetical protein Tco_0829364 [Tanacetum coccineum]